jgi:hypothetical protein
LPGEATQEPVRLKERRPVPRRGLATAWNAVRDEPAAADGARPGGKQFVVIAAGGHGRFGTGLGDSLVALVLP